MLMKWQQPRLEPLTSYERACGDCASGGAYTTGNDCTNGVSTATHACSSGGTAQKNKCTSGSVAV